MGCGFSKQDVTTLASEQSDQGAIDLTDIHAELTPQELDEIPTYSAVSGVFRPLSEGLGIGHSASEMSLQDSLHSMVKGAGLKISLRGSVSPLTEQSISDHQVKLKAFLRTCENAPGSLKKAVKVQAKRDNDWLRHEILVALPSPMHVLAEEKVCHVACRLEGAESPSSSSSSLSQ
eukprot:TRINITY_DN29008_c0_g1_i2.p1 TRINITY_DN29008_c0_g1~~TRINITY_DN29008_c0_g1_i2.p1  ORF type:complete len:176 (+),score=30.75 TRINITY_DN29008_c0_g1_i2:79-606(+)